MNLDLEIVHKRGQIAELDQKIAGLCVERMQLAEQIFQIKKQQQCSAVDLVQEAKVLANYQQIFQSMTSRERLVNFVQALISLTKVYPGAPPK